MDRVRLSPLVCALAAGLFVLAMGGQEVAASNALHVAMVAVSVTVAGASALGLTLAGARARDSRTVLLGGAFATMGALLTLDGLATPGLFAASSEPMAMAGSLALPVGIALMSLTAVPALRRTRRIAPLLAVQAVTASGVLVLAVFGFAFPSAVTRFGSGAQLLVSAVGLMLLSVLVLRAFRTSLLTRRVGDQLVVVGCLWLGIALIGQALVAPETLGFYLTHVLELGAIALA